jgi:hypothetical protein
LAVGVTSLTVTVSLDWLERPRLSLTVRVLERSAKGTRHG